MLSSLTWPNLTWKHWPEIFIAESDVVAAALAGRAGAEGQEDDVDDPLRGQHVAADHGRRLGRVQDGTFRNDDLDRVQAALLVGKTMISFKCYSIQFP